MLKAKFAFNGISVNDLGKAKEFYANTLGLELEDEKMGLSFKLPNAGKFFIYPKEDHQPATFTVLNFVVDDIDEAVEELTNAGVNFEYYDGLPQDERGILRGLSSNQGPDIAWFKDPAGNILSVLKDE